jgi:hypothetical protein
MVGCRLGYLKSLVAKEGLEGTLLHLVRAGMSVTFDEYDPRLRSQFEARSGGTRSPGTAIKTELPYRGAVPRISQDIHSKFGG